MARLPLRQLHASGPAKLLLLVILLLVIVYTHSRPRRAARLDQTVVDALWTAPRETVAQKYEDVRLAELAARKFNTRTAARLLRVPSLGDGSNPLDPGIDVYATRLNNFVANTLGTSTSKRVISEVLERMGKIVPPTKGDMPRTLYSTDRLGDSGVADLFRMWNALLPLPFDPRLAALLPETEWADPVRHGGPWDTIIADDGQINTQISHWLGENIRTGDNPWAIMWQKLSFGVLRADIYRYMAMLFEGGIYADSDTAPVAHPYLWGLGAKSILNKDLETMDRILQAHAQADRSRQRIWERSTPEEQAPLNATTQAILNTTASFAESSTGNSSWTPPYTGTHRRDRRSPIAGRDLAPPDDETSLLAPDINVIIAVEWDSSTAFNLRRISQWNWSRLAKSFRNSGAGRSLQFSQYVLAAKPFHPIFLDTMATIMELVENGADEKVGAMDLTGPGPFTDAVFRYLLVKYGVTPDQLRNLRHPIRVGDVLILQEGAYLAPETAMDREIEHVRTFFPTFPGSGLAHAVPGENLWYWGKGYRSWSGPQVVYHGPSTRWKSQEDEWNGE